MGQLERVKEIIDIYLKHGWRLECALVSAETRAELENVDPGVFENHAVKEAPVDGLWFSRPSHAGREAWELRLVSETPYALFETFEKEELVEDREEVRREMEVRLAEHAARF